MILMAQPPALAATFTLGCIVIHALKREAEMLTVLLVFALMILTLFAAIIWFDETNPVALEQTLTAISDSSNLQSGAE